MTIARKRNLPQLQEIWKNYTWKKDRLNYIA